MLHVTWKRYFSLFITLPSILFVVACSSSEEEAPAAGGAVEEPSVPASLEITPVTDADFGTVLVGSQKTLQFRLENVSANDLSNINITLTAPYTFEGGSFPGTTGDCTTDLLTSANCVVALNFAPTDVQTYTESMQVDFEESTVAKNTNHSLEGAGLDQITNLTLVAPSASPGNNPSPTVELEGLLPGATVEIHNDAACGSLQFSGTASAATAQITAGVTLSDATYSFYATQSSDGVTAPCSIVTVTYLLDTVAPNSPTEIFHTWDATSSASNTLNWTAATDNGAAGISHYEVAISSDGSSSSLISGGNWTDVGGGTSGQITSGLTLSTNTPYYTLVRSVDNAGNTSTEVTSFVWQYLANKPSDVSGLSAWFDGGDPASQFTDPGCTARVQSDGDKLGCLLDKSGNNRHATNTESFTAAAWGAGVAVQATGELSATYAATKAIDGTKTGGYDHCWYYSAATAKFNIQYDSGSGIVAKGIRINASHNNGTALGGVENFDIYGSNTATDYSDTDPANINPTMTLLGSYTARQQEGGNTEDNQDFFFSNNTTSYEYYIIVIHSVFDSYASMGEVELLEETGTINTQLSDNALNSFPVINFAASQLQFSTVDLTQSTIYVVKKTNGAYTLLGNKSSDTANLIQTGQSGGDKLLVRKGSSAPDGLSNSVSEDTWHELRFRIYSSGAVAPATNPGTATGTATSEYSSAYSGANSVDNLKTGYGWITGVGQTSNIKLNIDYGDAVVAKGIDLTNGHFAGSWTDTGIQNFTIYGSNEASDYADTVYANVTGTMTALGTFAAVAHTGGNGPDPQTFDFSSNTTAYRYYILRIADNLGNSNYMSVHEVELRLESGSDIEFAENGTDQTDGSNATVNSAESLSLNTIGGTQSTSFTGDIAEILIYNRALDSADRTTIENYLNAKWGI